MWEKTVIRNIEEDADKLQKLLVNCFENKQLKQSKKKKTGGTKQKLDKNSYKFNSNLLNYKPKRYEQLILFFCIYYSWMLGTYTRNHLWVSEGVCVCVCVCVLRMGGELEVPEN